MLIPTMSGKESVGTARVKAAGTTAQRRDRLEARLARGHTHLMVVMRTCEDRFLAAILSCTRLRQAVPRCKWSLSSSMIFPRAQQQLMVECAVLAASGPSGGVCHERERKLAVLYQRWEQASRSRLAGAGFKPPRAAAFKRRGSEQLREKTFVQEVR